MEITLKFVGKIVSLYFNLISNLYKYFLSQKLNTFFGNVRFISLLKKYTIL